MFITAIKKYESGIERARKKYEVKIKKDFFALPNQVTRFDAVTLQLLGFPLLPIFHAFDILLRVFLEFLDTGRAAEPVHRSFVGVGEVRVLADRFAAHRADRVAVRRGRLVLVRSGHRRYRTVPAPGVLCIGQRSKKNDPHDCNHYIPQHIRNLRI